MSSPAATPATRGRVHIAAICRNHRTCGGVSLPLAFERTDETWGDLLVALRRYGWKLETPDGATVADALCPACTKRSTPCADVPGHVRPGQSAFGDAIAGRPDQATR